MYLISYLLLCKSNFLDYFLMIQAYVDNDIVYIHTQKKKKKKVEVLQ
jgi:hypothetical protein